MIDDETHLGERFARLRAEERVTVPRFVWPRAERRGPLARLAIAATVALLIAVTFAIVRSRFATFSDADRMAVQAVADWHPPTDFLLRAPGSELLTTTPRIPDLKGMTR